MPKMHIRKSALIDAPTDKIYNILNNFNHWTAWSPWLIQEPEATVNVATDNKSYSWEGKRVGSGNMKITSEHKDQSVDYELTFLKPWESSSKVRFELSPTEGGTEVSWIMDSSLPFFMFWMKKMMTALIGMDYQRGLAMLKDYVENGKVHSKLDFKGTSKYPGCLYIGIHTPCTVETMGSQMQHDFTKLWSFMDDKKDIITAPPFSIYHKWDMVNNKIVYTSGIPVIQIPKNLPSNMVSGKIPETQVYTIKHTGSYQHLGNAWSTLYNMQQNKIFKINRKISPFEVYTNNPEEVSENDLTTEVHFAIK